MKNYDVIVIGGGPIGLAASAELSKSDKQTLVIEQFSFINQKGSSAGLSRQFRVQYAQKYMSQLALDSIPYWEELQKTTKDVLIDRVGSLWFGDPKLSSQEGGIEAAMHVMDELKIPYEPLTSAQIEKRFPFKDLPHAYSGFFQKDGGIINFEATQQALLTICKSAPNVSLLDNSPVTNIQSLANGEIIVSVKGQEDFTTQKLVICPGAYINDILKHFGLSVSIDIWEMSSAYYKKTKDVKLPTWFVFQEPQNTSLFYGFPEVEWANPGYVRVAPDIPDRIIIDPSQRCPNPSEKSLQLNEAWVKDHMVGLSHNSEFTSTCLIALSDNSKGLLLDNLPYSVNNNENIVVYTGGWAAKFVPLLGKILSDLALNNSTSYDISNFEIKYNTINKNPTRLKKIKLEQNIPTNRAVEVAIIGAGVSGLYSAYRLTNDVNNPLPADQVQIFEMSDRIGGRLESVDLPGMTISGELGGMRYMTSQKIVTSLIQDVFEDELTNISFPMGIEANHFGYFRKQRLRMDAWENAQKEGKKLQTRFYLNDDDIGYSGDQLFNKIIYDVLAKDPWFMKKYCNLISNPKEYAYHFKITREQWNDIKPNLTYNFDGPYLGMNVNDIGFWNLVKDRVSQEGYTFLAQAGGYYSNTINWNAAEAFPYMVGDFSKAKTEYRTIEGGYDLIAYALAKGYLKKDGANIWAGNRLITFVKQTSGNYKYELEFFNEETKTNWTLETNKIVLAMPRRSLELLDQNNFFFDQVSQTVLQKNMASVIKEPSLKILMGFEQPWWKEDFHTMAGHSITDLPLRQCYYFGTDPKDSHSLFLGSYNDMRTVTFWQALANSRKKGGIKKALFKARSTKKVSASDISDKVASNQATQVMVDEAMNQIKELHGREDIPMPYVTWYKDWTKDPYGGGYHAWKANYNIATTMAYMRNPNPEESIYICGEAYSDQQGWVEGAFCVAETMLEDHFDLLRPGWIPCDYYLGW